MKSEKTHIPMDFCQSALEEACGLLGILPNEATVYVHLFMAPKHYEVLIKTDCKLIGVPGDIIKGYDYWAVRSPSGDIVWSEGS